jgi:hypothetical protein
MALYERFEAELVAEGQVPISLSPCRDALERFALEQWTRGRNAYVSEALARLAREERQAS